VVRAAKGARKLFGLAIDGAKVGSGSVSADPALDLDDRK
jgi:hypothetical protein